MDTYNLITNWLSQKIEKDSVLLMYRRDSLLSNDKEPIHKKIPYQDGIVRFQSP